MAEKTTTYVVTEAGGGRPSIGGRLRTPGNIVELTDMQAEYELKRKTICTREEWAARQAEKNAAAEPAKA